MNTHMATFRSWHNGDGRGIVITFPDGATLHFGYDNLTRTGRALLDQILKRFRTTERATVTAGHAAGNPPGTVYEYSESNFRSSLSGEVDITSAELALLTVERERMSMLRSAWQMRNQLAGASLRPYSDHMSEAELALADQCRQEEHWSDYFA